MVNWEFLFYVLRRLGFGEKWVKWIRACLSSSSILVLVSGNPTLEFLVKRWLHQGDPLAPFLLNVVMEGLCRMMIQANANNIYSSILVGKHNILKLISYNMRITSSFLVMPLLKMCILLRWCWDVLNSFRDLKWTFTKFL